MKKIILVAFINVFSTLLHAQENLYPKLVNKIKELHPEIKLDSKLIAFNIWSLEDQESRKANQAFNKVFGVYEFAKLKGGTKGFVAIAVNRGNPNSEAAITLSKDGNTKIVSIPLGDIPELNAQQNSNMVFDSMGNSVYTNLKSNEIFESINKLITR